MGIDEKRKHSRVDSINLLNYVHFDEDQQAATQGMGRTLNVSKSGILIETHHPINLPNTVSLTIGFEEEMVDIKGHVVYTKENVDGMFESGIEFFDVDSTAETILDRYIEEFNARHR